MERKQWLEWRHKGIGSSDAASVHDIKDAFKTRLELVKEKIQDEPSEEETNYILEKGNRLEPIARRHFDAQYFLEHGVEIKFEPQIFEFDQLNFLRASLDGFATVDNIRIGIEIKYLGKDAFWAIENKSLPVRGGRVPEKYWIQMQHQMLVAGLHEMFFVGCIDDKGIHFCEVSPDPEFQKLHIKECSEVWRLVLTKKLPEPSIRDYKELRKKGAKGLANRYAKLKERIAKLEAEQNEVKKELLEMVDHPRMVCGGLSILEIERAGNIDYGKIPELQGVDLEQYRKKSSKYFKIGTADE